MAIGAGNLFCYCQGDLDQQKEQMNYAWKDYLKKRC